MENKITGVIVDIHESDAWYIDKERLVGKHCVLHNVDRTYVDKNYNEYVSGETRIDGLEYVFYAVKIQEIQKEI